MNRTHSGVLRLQSIRKNYSWAVALLLAALLFSISAKAQFYQGSYLGSGNARTIPIPGVTPNFVFIKNSSGSYSAIARITGMAGAQAVSIGNPALPNTITGLVANGFTLGTDISTNENNVVNHWMAVKDLAGSIATGTYTGNGSAQTINPGFQPDFVLVIAAGKESIFRQSQMPSNTSYGWASTILTTGILNFSAGGFPLGSSTAVNESGITFFYVAFKNVAGQFNTGTYTGNAVVDRVISGFGFAPDGHFSRPATTPSEYFKFRSFGAATDVSLAATIGTPQTNMIKVLGTDGVTVGSRPAVNLNGISIYWWAFKAATLFVLPVKLVSFTAEDKGTDVLLKWNTSSEDLNTLYELQRGNAANNFITLGTMPGKGVPSTYQFTDSRSFTGTVYYRLKSKDETGRETFSDVVVINRKVAISVSVSPNPAVNSIKVDNSSEKLNGSVAVINDVNGKEVHRFTLHSSQQINVYNWPAGTYILRIKDGTSIQIIKK